MSRFLALVLMTVTSVVLAVFSAPLPTDPQLPWLRLGLPLALVGLLFGVLAADRHVLWSTLTVVAAALALLFSGPGGETDSRRPKAPAPPGVTAMRPSALPLTHYGLLLIPPIALYAGSFLGAWVMRRRNYALTEPAAEE